MSSVQPLLDSGGRRRSPATMPGFRAGRPPRNKFTLLADALGHTMRA